MLCCASSVNELKTQSGRSANLNRSQFDSNSRLQLRRYMGGILPIGRKT